MSAFVKAARRSAGGARDSLPGNALSFLDPDLPNLPLAGSNKRSSAPILQGR